jgi:NTP pyrophosphatase (non-canonical NTP hydrolase)
MSEYSFQQYHNETEFTRNSPDSNHNTIGYALLGLIGEVGEVVQSLDIYDVEITSEDENAAIKLLLEFQALAEKIETLKKRIRNQQTPVLAEVGFIPEELTEEMGGVYWYLNNLATQAGLSMATVAEANKALLKRRWDNNPRWMTNGGVKTH